MLSDQITFFFLFRSGIFQQLLAQWYWINFKSQSYTDPIRYTMRRKELCIWNNFTKILAFDNFSKEQEK